MTLILNLKNQICSELKEKFRDSITDQIALHDKEYIDYIDCELEYQNSIGKLIQTRVEQFIQNGQLKSFDIVKILMENADEAVDLEAQPPKLEFIDLLYRLTSQSLYSSFVT